LESISGLLKSLKIRAQHVNKYVVLRILTEKVSCVGFY
jgi:hypothetical protein